MAAAVLGCSVCCAAAGHYALAFWRTAGADEGHGIAAMTVHVFNESGSPVPNVAVHFNGSLGDKVAVTDYRGYAELGFQFSGSPAYVYCTDGGGATSDQTPQLYNHDAHRLYEIGFMYRTSASNPGTFDTSWCGDLLSITQAPRTNSLTFSTPTCTNYSSDTRDLAATAHVSFGNTFVATADRVVALRAHLTKGFQTRFRWTGQIFEGGPDGPPMGPKKILYNEYIEGDNKYVLNYALDECALKPGNTYYVEFAAADGSIVNAYECLNNVYSGGDLYEDGAVVPGKELQAWVCGMSSGTSNVGTVQGTVTNASGQPVAGATITLSPGGRTVQTGAAGVYRCYNVAPGTYSITASAPGCASSTSAGRVVSVGGILQTDFQLGTTAGPIQILSTTGGAIQAGAQDVPVTMMVRNNGAGDVFVRSSGLAFRRGSTDSSSYFSVTASGSNPAVIRGGATAQFSFLVDVAPNLPAGNYTVQGRLEADVNLRPNGSFEADTYFPNYTGPSNWEWHSDDPPSVARVSYEHQVCYESTGGIPTPTRRVRARWIGKWSDTGGTNKKQGLRITLPSSDGLSSRRTELDIGCGTSSHKIYIATGIGDRQVSFIPGKYYQIDADLLSSGASTYVVTPLEEPGRLPETIHGTTTSTGGLGIKWGKMYASGSEEMSCREFHYWCEDGAGSAVYEQHWLATDGLLPTQNGWGLDSSGAQSMLPGAPWSSDTHFFANDTDKIEGSRALDVWFSPSGSDKQLYLSSESGSSSPRIAVEPSTTYTLSFWYKMTTYNGASNYLLKTLWEEYDSLGQPYFQRGVDPPFHYNEPEPFSGGWRKVTYRFTTSQWAASCRFMLQLFKPGSDTAAAVVRLDDVRLIGPNPYMDTTADSPGTFTSAFAAPSVAAAKARPDGDSVTLTGVAATGYAAGQTTRFYIEDANRTSGILVDKTGGSGDLGVLENDLVTLTATLATIDGERVLVQPNVTSRMAGIAPSSVALIGRNLGGGPDGYTPGVEGGMGLNNVGLLVTVCGSINSAGGEAFYVDDGSGLSDGTGAGVKVIAPGIPVQSGATHAVVTGFSSVENVGGTYHRVVRPRRAGDIVWL